MYVVVYKCQSQSPSRNLPTPPTPPFVAESLFATFVTVAALPVSSSLPFSWLQLISDIGQYLSVLLHSV